MLYNNIKIAFRNLTRNSGYALLNIGGLALGMTIVMVIGLWVYDELSFNKYHANYDRIGQVWSGSINPETTKIDGGYAIQLPVANTLKSNYPQYFKHVLTAWWVGDFTLALDDKKLTRRGEFIEAGVIDMLSLKMLKGNTESLTEANGIIISQSAAEALFGDLDVLNKTVRINNKMDAMVTGVYEDLPANNQFSEVKFFGAWPLWVSANAWIKEKDTDWDNRPFNIYVELQPNAPVEKVNAAIKDLYAKNVPADFWKVIEKDRPFVQIVPMSTWHLYSEFENGVPVGGRITFVWLFGIVGAFVLVLACINFVNLSTARSEKRSKEIGVRKAIGSGRMQLVTQLLTESFVTVALAFLISLVLLSLAHPLFNQIADKEILLPYNNLVFWASTLAFITITGFLAGLYPAFYLSSFQPVKVLKGALHVGRYAALPRKVLVVTQFTVSVVLIIGTIIVYEQIQFARNRPIGYNRAGLITIDMNDPGYDGKRNVLRSELLNTGVVTEAGVASSPVTEIWNVTGGYRWPDQQMPSLDANFVNCNVTPEFGKAIGWEFASGRDFSTDIASDTTDAIIINEAAAKYMGLDNPVGQRLEDVDEFGNLKWSKEIIGVVKDVIMDSPYKPVQQTIYYYNPKSSRGIMHIRINPTVSARVALPKIEAVLKKVVPSALFDHSFVDDQYAAKFRQEERVGQLSGIFAALAIFISCLGLFGLASFVAEQRTKEIGIRKVLGATIFNLWKMLSKDFLVLVLIACFIGIPVAWYAMTNWLGKYEYHTSISWWIFLISCAGALLITLVTVSFHAIRTALLNPVKSLRSE